jgi:hypothetical protein
MSNHSIPCYICHLYVFVDKSVLRYKFLNFGYLTSGRYMFKFRVPEIRTLFRVPDIRTLCLNFGYLTSGRYKFKFGVSDIRTLYVYISGTWHPDVICLSEQGCEDTWLFCEVKRGPTAKYFGKNWWNCIDGVRWLTHLRLRHSPELPVLRHSQCIFTWWDTGYFRVS